MNNDLQSLFDQNNEAWQRLHFTVAAHDDTAFIWVSADRGHKLHEIQDKIQEAFPQCHHHILHLPTKINIRPFAPFLMQSVKTIFTEGNKNILHIWGIDSHLTKEKKLANQLNFERETLFTQLPFVVIVYANTASSLIVQRFARDFWDWLVNYFEFKSTRDELTLREKDLVNEITLSDNQKLTIFDKDTEGRIAQLENELEQFKANDRKADRVSILIQLAGEYNEIPDYQNALNALETALALTDNEPTLEAQKSTVQNNLALVYRDLGNYEKAAGLLEKALASAIKNFGAEHPHVAIRQSNLAMVYRDLGNYDKAAALLEEALASDIKNFGSDNPNVAIRQSNLAMVYQDLGNYEKAADLLEQALASDIKNFGSDNPNVAIRQSNLAMVYQDLRRYAEATELAEKALASNEKNFGKEHPIVATSQNHLANVYKRLEQEEKSQALFQKSYDIYLKVLGAEHPYTQLAKSMLSSPPPQ